MTTKYSFNDGGFDSESIELTGWKLWVRIVLLLPVIVIVLFLALISEYQLANLVWGWMNIKYGINPFSTANYAHSQYMHWIEECKYQDSYLLNRWNLP